MIQISRFVRNVFAAGIPALALSFAGCATSGGAMMADKGMMKEKSSMMAMDPMKAERVSIDRFSAAAGHLQGDSIAICLGPIRR
jgi:hypothetical protein